MSGYIKKESAEKVVEASHIEEVIGNFVTLKRAGANFKGFSPFGEEKTPSFIVSPAKQIFKDFCTGRSGNVVSFLICKGMSYPEAIEYIAKKYNISLDYETNEFSEKKKILLDKKEDLRKVLTLVHELYIKEYKNLEENHPAKKEVVEHRLYNEETILDWGIGFAPENYLYDKLKKSKYIEQGENLGLINSSEHNKWDQYSNKVIYPIHDRNGLLIGFAGRDVSGKTKVAKWINPKVDEHNILYNKSRVWYGLHKAKVEIRKRGEAYIVEGYNDVIAWHRFGLENTVAACGTAIPDENINELKKLCEKVVFCLDPDRAGIEAVLKLIPRFIKQGFRTEVIQLDFDPDDYVREYHEVITVSGGLDIMFKTPGIRHDGFRLLVNEHIKKGYIKQEEKLEAAKKELLILNNSHEDALLILNDEKAEIEGDLLSAKNLLNDLNLQKGKKSEEYLAQQKITTTLSGKLDSKKYELKNLTFSVEFKNQKKKVEEYSLEFDIAFKNSETSRSSGAKKLCFDIVNVTDDAYFTAYLNWIQIESKVPKATLNSWIKELRIDVVDIVNIDSSLDFVLPEEVKESLNDLFHVIKNYGLFMSNNKIFMQLPASDKKVYFSCVSNFMIEVLQHMNDDKFPRKLIKMRNTENKEVIFDTASENINTPQTFDNMLTSYGNFRFDGDRKDQLSLRRFLMDNMGDGKKIDVMGWQISEKIWVWNNKITDVKGIDIPIDENGMFVFDKVNYYVPSANKIYKGNSSKYKPQKAFIVQENKTLFNEWMNKVYKVHRDHAISGLLFGLASLFQDIIVDEYKAFPILFLYGPGSSGKDGLIRCIQSLTGIPQNAISLEGDVSTAKGQIRKFAQFRNGTVHLSEFYTGNSKLDGMLKGMYDRIGYEKGNIESAVATDSVEIESSVLLTGNQYPDKEALITRLVWNEMTKTQFSESEMKEYNELSDMTNGGASGYANSLFKYRQVFEQKFSINFRHWKGILEAKFKDPKARIIANLAVLGATYQILRDDTNSEVLFPFSQDDMFQHFEKEIKNQLAKMNSASLIIRFWHCFIASLRGHKDTRIQVGYIVNLEGNTLFFNWTHVIHKMEDLWWRQYKEGFPGSATLKEEFIKENLIIKNISSYSYKTGRDANRTSAVGINLLALPKETREDIIGYIMFQKEEGTFWEKSQETGDSSGNKPTQEAVPLSLEDNANFFEE